MCGHDSASALGYLISTEAATIASLLHTVSHWAWIMVNKWLFVKNMNKCFIIN